MFERLDDRGWTLEGFQPLTFGNDTQQDGGRLPREPEVSPDTRQI